MSISVEANMRIPGLTVCLDHQLAQVYGNNSASRFTKLASEAPAIPKAGDPLDVTVGNGMISSCTVTRADWSEDRSIFIVSCRYSKTRITADEYHALLNDSDWTHKLLGA